MKKKLFLPILLTALLFTVGCNNNSGGGGGGSGGGDGGGDDGGEGEPVKNQTVTFYIDYWHSEEPFYEMEWYSNKPLGECPAKCKLTSADATDPLFPVFLGWSQYSSSIDDSHIWNFETDTKGGIELTLYGIWVAEQ